MEIKLQLYADEICCGIDAHKKSIVCCILNGPLDTNKLHRTFGTITQQLYQALDWINENHATHFFSKAQVNIWFPYLMFS